MPFCSSCGASLQPSSQFCTACGAKAGSPSPEQERYYVAYATGQTVGPMGCDAVRSLISEQKINITDSIRTENANSWTPVAQSTFAPLVTQQATASRLAASTCPRCGAAMVAVMRRSKLGLALIIIGIVTTPLIIGIPIFVIGFIMRWGGKGAVAYQCPRCNYSSQ